MLIKEEVINIMKICMIGLGSIGKRHLKNIVKVLNEKKEIFEIDALRNGNNKLPSEIAEMIHQEYYSYNDLPDDYDVVFITNPTVFHFDTLLKIVKKTKHIFMEKPIFNHTDYKIDDIELRPAGVYYVACPLRHKEIIKYIKKQISAGEHIISARAISSSYLPNWRKGVDYRNVYSARKELGGGVAIDLIHEWDYLTYLFGMPETIYQISGKYSDLEINSEDIAVYIAKYADKVMEIHLDYIGQKLERRLELLTNDTRYDVDLTQNKIEIYHNYEKKEEISFPEEDFYMNEMKYFFECIDGKKKNINTFANAIEVMKLV